MFFSQATDTGCGQATSQVGPFYCPLDRQVYFDLDFLVQLQEQFGATGDLAAQYIVAHEFGHHVQNLLGTNEAVNQAQQQGAGERQRAVRGPRAAGRLLRRGLGLRRVPSASRSSPAEVTNEAINAAEAVGDDRIQQRTQGRIDPESWTHGSADQRAMWFRRGFETGDPTQCTTFEEIGPRRPRAAGASAAASAQRSADGWGYCPVPCAWRSPPAAGTLPASTR